MAKVWRTVFDQKYFFVVQSWENSRDSGQCRARQLRQNGAAHL